MLMSALHSITEGETEAACVQLHSCGGWIKIKNARGGKKLVKGAELGTESSEAFGIRD